MAKEKDPLADYFTSEEESYAAYKRDKREREEKENREKELSEQQDYDDLSSEEDYIENIYEKIMLDDEPQPWTDEKIERFWQEIDASIIKEETERELEDWINSHKTIKSLLKLKNKLGNEAGSEVTRRLIEEIGIYKFDTETISLQQAVNFSRRRVVSSDVKAPEIRYFSEEQIERFLSDAYNDEVSSVFYRFRYPEDYQWLNDEYNVRYDCDGTPSFIVVGNHEEDYSEIEIDDLETWPICETTEIDIDTEVEINFQKFLTELDDITADKDCRWDIVLRIPYSQMAKVSTFEIRLIDHLNKQDIRARVSISLSQPDKSISERACLYAFLLRMI